jgi:hypothetical protein
MTEFIWHWRNGNTRIYTRKMDIAEKAMKKGFSVIQKKVKTNIIKF